MYSLKTPILKCWCHALYLSENMQTTPKVDSVD